MSLGLGFTQSSERERERERESMATSTSGSLLAYSGGCGLTRSSPLVPDKILPNCFFLLSSGCSFGACVQLCAGHHHHHLHHHQHPPVVGCFFSFDFLYVVLVIPRICVEEVTGASLEV